jgi:hypothetical protein
MVAVRHWRREQVCDGMAAHKARTRCFKYKELSGPLAAQKLVDMSIAQFRG